VPFLLLRFLWASKENEGLAANQLDRAIEVSRSPHHFAFSAYCGCGSIETELWELATIMCSLPSFTTLFLFGMPGGGSQMLTHQFLDFFH
jgi:hypothetical protein